MQTAFKEQREVGNEPVQSLMVEPGHHVVVWTPETLDLSRKQVGLQRLEGRHFAVFFDQYILERDQSEAIFKDQTGQPRQLVRYTKTAMACAVETLIQFGGRGVVILNSLLDRPQAALVQFEAKLEQAGWFDKEKHPRLDDLAKIIQSLTEAGAWSDAYEAQAAEDLLQAISTAIIHRETYADDLMGEAQRAREGKQGRANLTRTEQQYLAEIGFVVPADVAALDVKKAVSQARISGVSPEMIELMQANNEAIVTVLSEAMNRQAETFARALAELKGATDAGRSSNNAGIGNADGDTITHRELPERPEPQSSAGKPRRANRSLESGTDGGEEERIDFIIADAVERISTGKAEGKPNKVN